MYVQVDDLFLQLSGSCPVLDNNGMFQTSASTASRIIWAGFLGLCSFTYCGTRTNVMSTPKERDRGCIQGACSSIFRFPGSVKPVRALQFHICLLLRGGSARRCLSPAVICICRPQWPRGLRHEPASTTRPLGPWVRIPLKARICVSVYSVFVLSCVQVASLRRAEVPSK
jgi:hypothetical protein